MRIAAGLILAAATLGWAHSVTASGVSTTMGVGVTVVRPCSITAQPAGAVSSSVRLSCPYYRGPSVLLGNGSLQRPSTTEVFQVPGEASPAGVRVVTLNF